MKKILIILILGILPLFLEAQVSLYSTGYKAFRKTTYTIDLENSRVTDSSSVLFWFAKNMVKISVNYQYKNIYFIGLPFTDILSSGDTVKRVQCKDDGGFLCALSTGKYKGNDFISIEYNNIIFFYEVKETKERPWDNDPIEIEPFKMRTDPYTKDEWDALFKSCSKFSKNLLKAF